MIPVGRRQNWTLKWLAESVPVGIPRRVVFVKLKPRDCTIMLLKLPASVEKLIKCSRNHAAVGNVQRDVDEKVEPRLWVDQSFNCLVDLECLVLHAGAALSHATSSNHTLPHSEPPCRSRVCGKQPKHQKRPSTGDETDQEEEELPLGEGSPLVLHTGCGEEAVHDPLVVRWHLSPETHEDRVENTMAVRKGCSSRVYHMEIWDH